MEVGKVDISVVSRALFETLIAEYTMIDARLSKINDELEAFVKSKPVCQALLPIPGIGVIVARALYVAVANTSDFRTGRDLAAFLSLVPRQRSTGGKMILLGMSKRGNTYVRMLMIHGIRSAFCNRKKRKSRMLRL